MADREFEVALAEEDEGTVSATFPALGCTSQGETRVGALEMIREAIEDSTSSH